MSVRTLLMQILLLLLVALLGFIVALVGIFVVWLWIPHPTWQQQMLTAAGAGLFTATVPTIVYFWLVSRG